MEIIFIINCTRLDDYINVEITSSSLANRISETKKKKKKKKATKNP